MKTAAKKVSLILAVIAVVAGSAAPANAGNWQGHGGNISLRGAGMGFGMHQGSGMGHAMRHGMGMMNDRMGMNGVGFGAMHHMGYHNGHFVGHHNIGFGMGFGGGNGFNTNGGVTRPLPQNQGQDLADTIQQQRLNDAARQELLSQQKRSTGQTSSGNASNSVKTYSW